ncbi:MAG TPA: choline kinase, partial [Gammaproteobacteria bacterium]|nr:choline kinase [Gammaproteobacteria bacterium]
VHGVMRCNELAASRAAWAVGLAPKVVYSAPGVLVMNFLRGRTLVSKDVQREETLRKILSLIGRCHRYMPAYIRGSANLFWVFQVLRNYAATLRDENNRLAAQLPCLMEIADRLEEAVGTIQLVFGHNDLLAANFIDDGDRLWLIDWDYAGFNSPLFDLANLASNNGLSVEQEDWVLEIYFDRRPDDGLRRAYYAMKCASLLREGFWSLVSETHSAIDFDYVSYTEKNLERFEEAWQRFQYDFGKQ